MFSVDTKPSPVTLQVSLQTFKDLCIENPELRLELTAQGELIAMPPAGWESSRYNGKLTTRVSNWNDSTNSGEVLDSSGGFMLPNGALRWR